MFSWLSKSKTGRRRRRNRRLKAVLPKSTLDPYVKVFFGQEERVTEVLDNGGTDVDFSSDENRWTFEFDGFPTAESGKIQPELNVQVWDDDGALQPDDLVGKGNFPLEWVKSKPNEEIFLLVDLTDETETEFCGRVEVSCRFVPAEDVPKKEGMETHPGTLHVGIYKAVHLRDTDDEASFISPRKAIFILFCYFMIGSIFMWKHEGYAYLDSFYFCVVTLTTVGYGKVVPMTQAGRFFIAVFILTGIGLIAAALGAMTQWIVQQKEKLQQEKERLKAEEHKKKIEARKKHTARRRSVHKSSEVAPDPGSEPIEPVELPDEAKEDGPPRKDCCPYEKAFTSGTAKTIYFFLTVQFTGILIFCTMEDHTFIDGFYFSCVTLTTVGYGDLTFDTEGGRVFAIFWILIGTTALARMLSAVIDSKSQEVAAAFAEKKAKRLLMKRTDLRVLDKDGSGQVTKMSFLMYKLVALGRCEQWHIDDILSQFDALDEDGSGTLEIADFKKAQERESEELRQRVLAHKGHLRDMSFSPSIPLSQISELPSPDFKERGSV